MQAASSAVTGELLSSEGAYVLELKRGVSLYMSPLLLLSLHDSVVTESQVQKLFSNWTTLVCGGTPVGAGAAWLCACRGPRVPL